jgi:hypothetical protein
LNALRGMGQISKIDVSHVFEEGEPEKLKFMKLLLFIIPFLILYWGG